MKIPSENRPRCFANMRRLFQYSLAASAPPFTVLPVFLLTVFPWAMFSSIVLLMNAPAYAACLVRDYSEAHLKRYPKQEIRHVTLSVNSEHGEERDDLPKPDSYTRYYPFTLSYQMVRNDRERLVQAKGYCDSDVYPFSEQGATCYVVDEGNSQASTRNRPTSATPAPAFTLSYRERGPSGAEGVWRLLSLRPGVEFRDTQTGEKLRIPAVDRQSLIEDPRSDLSGGFEPTMAFPKGCPKVFEHTLDHAPRAMNETLLSLVRLSLARPTVTARNLYHHSAMLWDIFASFNQRPDQTLFGYRQPSIRANNINMQNTMVYASYYLLKKRYRDEPGNEVLGNVLGEGLGDSAEAVGNIDWILDRTLTLRGLNHQRFPRTRALARAFAEGILNKTENDGSREKTQYDPDPDYQLINSFSAAHINLPGLSTPPALNNDPVAPDFLWNDAGIDFSERMHISYWNPLFIPGSADQNGNSQDFSQSPLTLHWGRLPTFGDLSEHYDAEAGVYFNPALEFLTFEEHRDAFIKQNLAVARASLWHNPVADGRYNISFAGDEPEYVNITDNTPGAEEIDISPLSMGNHPLGTNDGRGYGPEVYDPARRKTYNYAPYRVRAADFYRSIAEFWADGPDSETPPGHWNTLANYILDQMEHHTMPWQWRGQGPVLGKVEFALRTYLTLNGALHDAGVVAWGIKGAFQGGRPVTVIRKLAAMAEQDRAFGQRLVELSDGLLKLKDTNYRVPLAYIDAAQECSASKLQDEVRFDIVRSQRAVVRARVRAGHTIRFVAEEDDYGSLTCFAVWQEQDKLWIHSWLGHQIFQSADGSGRMRPELAPEEVQRRRVFASLGVSGTGWMLAENWDTYQKVSFVTPPFPGFVSGHSTFSRAAAEALAGVTGSAFFPGGLGTYPAPLLEFEQNTTGKRFSFQWATYYDAADQSGASRIYGGIHASYDDLPARKIGAEIGRLAVEKASEIFAR